MERNRSANPRFRESRDSAPVVEQFANNIGPRRLNFSSHQTLPFPENSDHGDFRSQRSSLKRNPLQSDPWNQEAQTGFSNQQDQKQYSPANSLFRSRSTANTRLPDSISNNRLQDSNQSWSIALPAKQVVNKSIPTDFTDPNLFPEPSSQQMQHLAKRERLKEALKQLAPTPGTSNPIRSSKSPRPNPVLAPISFPSPSELNGHERPTSLHHPLNPYRTPTPPRSSQVFSTLDVSSLSNSRNPSDVLKLRFEAQKPSESGRHESTSDLFNRIRPGYVLKRDIRTPEAMRDYRVSGSLVAQPGRVLYKYRPSSLEELLRPANPRLLDQDRVCRHLYSFLSLQEINLVQSVIPHSERVLTSKSEPFKDPYCLQRLFDGTNLADSRFFLYWVMPTVRNTRQLYSQVQRDRSGSQYQGNTLISADAARTLRSLTKFLSPDYQQYYVNYLTEVLELFDSMRTVPYLQGFSSVPGCLLMAGHTNPEVLAYLVHLFSATDLNLLFADQVTNMNTFIQMILGLYKLRNTTCVASRDPDFATRTELTLLEWISTCFTVYLGLFESLGFLAYLAQYGSIALVCMSLSVMEYCLVDERLRNSAELMYAEQRTPFQPKLSPWQKRIKEVSIVQKALQLERDVVVSTRFKEWKRNAVVPNKNRGPTQNMNHAEEAVKTFPPVPNVRYMNPAVIEHFDPNSSTHQFSSPPQPITAVNTHHFQSPNFVQTHSSNMNAEQNSQPNAQLVSLQGPQAERKPTRSPRMSGTWKEPFSVSNGVPATPIKAFLVPQTQPILLRRSEPQPQLTRLDSTPQNSRFWMDKPGPTNENKTSQVNLRNNVTITLPQTTSMGVNMSNPWQNTLQGSQVAHETKSKNLLSLPANMVQNLGSNSQGTGQSIRHLKESYRPLLSSTYGPPGRQDPFRSAVAAHHPQQPVQQYQPVAVQQPTATVSGYSQPRADHGQQFSHFANNQVAQSPLRSFHGYSQSENIEAQPSVMVQPQRQQVETRAGSHNVRESRSAEPFHRMPENYWSQTQNNQRVASPSPGSRRNPLLSMPRF